MDITGLHIGETWVVDFTFRDYAGNALDLTGATILFRVTAKGFSKDFLIGAGVVVVNAATGTGQLTVQPNAQTGFSPLARYRYEASVTTNAGDTSVQQEGAWVVEPRL